MKNTKKLLISITLIGLSQSLSAQIYDRTTVHLCANKVYNNDLTDIHTISIATELSNEPRVNVAGTPFSNSNISESTHFASAPNAYSDFEELRSTQIRGFHASVNTGAWLFNGNLSALQKTPLPAFGFLLGARLNKFTIDAGFNFWWTNTQRSLTVHKDDSTFHASYQVGLYAGIDLGYQLYRGRRSEFNALGGIGLNYFGTSYDSNRHIYFSTPDLNIGLGYRVYLRYRNYGFQQVSSYFSVQAKYHFLNYNNPGGTPINGNAFSITLEYGGYWHNHLQSSGRGDSGGVLWDSFWKGFWEGVSRSPRK